MKTLNPFSEYDLMPLHMKKGAKKKAEGGFELKPPSRVPEKTLPLYGPTPLDTSLQYSEVNEQLRDELYPEKDNSRKIANSVYAGLALFNAFLPGDRIEEPIVHPLESYIPAQYGRGSQAIANYGAKISNTGYRRNSKDVNEPMLTIPTNHISMQGVDFPVYGEDNLGNGQMMYPGEEYLFEGDSITEIPMARYGKKVKKSKKKKNTY